MEEHLFIQTITRHRGAIERVCRTFGRSADLDDLRQEVLLGLWGAWKRHRPQEPSVAWVWRVATNCCISWWRSRKRQIPTEPLFDFDLPDDDSLRQQSYHLRQMIALLPQDEQRLIGLYLDGWTTREISVILGISESNVTTRMSRIRQKLKTMYEQ